MLSEHSSPLTLLPFGLRTWLCRYTCLLLLISMLRHRQAIFECKGDKLSSSAECRIQTWMSQDTYSPADWIPTHKLTELSRIKLKTCTPVYRQSQVRKSTDSGVKWAECSLIIGTGCRVQVFSLILDSSVGMSASIQPSCDLVSGTPGSNPAFSRGTQLVSFRFEYRLPVPEHRN